MMTQIDRSDADDVRLSIEGDREAFGRLYDRHARGVRAVVAGVSGDFSAVEDLTQETFLRGYRRLATLRDAGGFRRWIQGVARMVAQERKRELIRNRYRVGAHNDRIETSDEVRDEVSCREEQRRVVSAVASLPERERLAVHAYFFEERRGDDAASVIGMSRSGFYAVLERGLNRLRKQLGVKSANARNMK